MAATLVYSYQGLVNWAKTASNGIIADKLATPRGISIASSDGTGAGSAVNFDGSGAVTLKLPATIKASLTGNATTATSATTASSATTATTASKLSNTTKIGDNGQPVYFSNAGVPVACTKIGTGSASLPVMIPTSAPSSPANGYIWIEA